MKRLLSICVSALLILWCSFLWYFQTYALPWGEWDISQEGFKIHVWNFAPWGKQLLNESDGTTQWVVNTTLATILEKLIVVFWVIAGLMMTIGAGYMIIYHGQDELLNRWKSIFTWGIIALIIALCAGLIVRLFAYLLY